MIISMESVCCHKETSQDESVLEKQKESFIIASTNWEIENNKQLDDCISTISVLQAPDRTNLEDVVSLDTCVALKSDPSKESCKAEFKITNKQKIARIAVVSEASVLEFFKQSGEYATTVFAEFVDEFQDHAVYFAEAKIDPPSAEASIKFTRTKNKGTSMWIYGIKLILTEVTSDNSKNMFDLDIINNFLSNQIKSDKAEMAKKFLESFAANESNSINNMNMCFQKLPLMSVNSQKCQENNVSSEMSQLNNTHQRTGGNDIPVSQNLIELKNYIDEKFVSLERRLIEKIEYMDEKTNKKLDAIFKKLELNVNQ